MGIQGLSTFIDDNRDIYLSEHMLHDTKIIIDGSNLYYFLYFQYDICHQLGGDYNFYAQMCKRFFKLLKKCNVRPYVVLDGGYDPDDRKLETVLKRVNDRKKTAKLICDQYRGCILPILCYETFRQVLVEMDIPHVSCVYEADHEIAVLANRWKCPVLSRDSDFFAYKLEGGYISLDYINLTLCICNRQTGEKDVLPRDKNVKVEEDEFKYIPVMYYNCERFLKQFEKEEDGFILPVLATVVGNDYVNVSFLENFYKQLKATKSPSQKLPSTRDRISAVIRWLEGKKNEADALNFILGTVPKEQREKLREVLMRSIKDYEEIEEFSYCDIEHILETFESNVLIKDTESGIENEELTDVDKITMLAENTETVECARSMDFYGRKLPSWFFNKMRECEINGSFFQNVTVLHRVLFNCQVEILKEPSSYDCSRDIRALIYGIALGPVEGDRTRERSRENAVEEYDRESINVKKYYVKPLSILNGSAVPDLGSIADMSQEDRKNVLMASFGHSCESLNEGMDDSSVLMIFLLSYWVKNSRPKVTEGHLNALIICIIMLHIKDLEWLRTKSAYKLPKHKPVLFRDIVTACEGMTKARFDFFKQHFKRHFKSPTHSSRNPRDNKVVHGFTQFQACFLDVYYLNQVLLKPVSVPSPSVILNCSFVYNLCCDLNSRLHANPYIDDMLTRGSTLHRLFTSWRDMVIDLCPGAEFSGQKKEGQALKTKSKAKKRAKKEKRKKTPKTGEEASLSEEDDDEDEAEKLEVLVNCDVSNKFALLEM